MWQVLNVVLFPATALHEYSHAVLLVPWTISREVEMSPRQGHAEIRVRTRGAPWWLHRLAALAPTLFGSLAAVFAILFATGFVESTVRDPEVACALAAYWFSYTWPSLPDLVEAFR